MNSKTIRWAARIMAMTFAGFLGVFALDVFDEGKSVGESILAFAIHLIPTWLVLAALAVAWRNELAGAVLFFLLAASYPAITGSRFPLSTILTIAGPPFVIGIMFVLAGFRDSS